MAKKKNSTLIVILLIGAILIYGGSQGGFDNIFTFIGGGTPAPITPPPNNVQPTLMSYTNVLSFSPNPACRGSSVTGSIDSNIPNGVCTLFIMGAGWTPFATFNLNANGDVSDSRVITVAGTSQFQAVCCDANGNCKISNAVSLTVRVCDNDGDGNPDDTDPDDDNDGYSDEDEIDAGTNLLDPDSHPTETEPIICYDSDISLIPFEEQLKFAGFCTDSSGTDSDYCYEGTDHLIEYYCEPISSPPAERHCSYTSYNCPGMIPGSHCSAGKCVIDGDGGSGDGINYGGYASCEAWANAEGKDNYVTGIPTITNLDTCESHAQSYCSQFGSAEPHTFGGIPPGYVTMLDFDTPDCCIWNCNWSWN